MTVILVELVPSSDTGAEPDLNVPARLKHSLPVLILPLMLASVIS